jgi:hypothetical protein
VTRHGTGFILKQEKSDAHPARPTFPAPQIDQLIQIPIYLVNVTGARIARGSFREVVPVHRLAYSFGWDGSEVVPPGSSLVEIDLAEQLDGTLLRLTHTGLPNAEQCAGHAEGWAHYLGRLAEATAGRDPGPDPWHGRTGRE